MINTKINIKYVTKKPVKIKEKNKLRNITKYFIFEFFHKYT